MAGLKTIKTKIRATARTRAVTKAMEAVSAAKMRKAQGAALKGRAYARAAAAVLGRVAGARELAGHPLVAERPLRRALYVVITSDKGLAGGLNSGVLRAAQTDMERSGAAEIEIIAVGRKARDYFARLARKATAEGPRYALQHYYPNTQEITHELVERLVHEAAARFESGEVDAVRMAYQNFVSTFEQRPVARTVFPLSLKELRLVVADILPARGKDSAPEELLQSPATYAVEPSEQEILDALLPRLSAVFVYHGLLEALASEHSARMVAMKSASDKAVERGHALTLQFNKARQAAITREVSEIIGGMETINV